MMQIRHLSLVFAASLILFTACQTQQGAYYQNFDPEDVQAGIIGNQDFDMEIAYVGAIGHSFIYECHIQNLSDQPIRLDKSQFYLAHGEDGIIFPSEGDAIANQLSKDQRRLKKNKKTARTLGIIGVGLGTVFGVANGASVGQSLLVNAEPIVYIFDEQRWYKRGIESIEDEMEYVKSAQFEDYILPPGESVTRDILFATTKMKSDVTVYFTLDEEQYSVIFPKRLFR